MYNTASSTYLSLLLLFLLAARLAIAVVLVPGKVGDHGGGERGQTAHVRGAHDPQTVVGRRSSVVAAVIVVGVVGVVVDEALDGGEAGFPGSGTGRRPRRFGEFFPRRSG